MNVLLVGDGGREHALAWKLAMSPLLKKLYVAPGNAGTAEIAENIPIKATAIDELRKFASEKHIDLTIVSKDDPLALGIVDEFRSHDLRIFGPTKAAAQIESSKVFSKELMEMMSIPTSPFRVVRDHNQAMLLARVHFTGTDHGPLVVKASGLALGKGAYVCKNLDAATKAIDKIMIERVHGSAGDQVILEEFVAGPEVSPHVFSDGRHFVMFPVAQDHKPIFDNDQGDNTGGMGSIAPVPWFDAHDDVSNAIVGPALLAMQKQGTPFQGFLFPGIKCSEEGLMVLEFNARPGDPETQVFMRLLKTDLLEIILAAEEGRLDTVNVEWNPGFAACVVMASEGYPSPDYKKGRPITGIKEAEKLPGVKVFHAGTDMRDGELVTSGGRVLGVSAVGATLQEAVSMAYLGVDKIHFTGMQYRRDIGEKSLRMAT